LERLKDGDNEREEMLTVFTKKRRQRRHNIQHSCIQHNYTQHNNKNTTISTTFNGFMLSVIYADCFINIVIVLK